MGGSNKGQQMAQQDQTYALQQGGALQANNQATADHYNQLGQGYSQQADQAYKDLAANPGYTPDQISQIEDQAGLSGLKTSDPALQSNFLTPDEQQASYLTSGEQSGIMGDQSGINAGEAGVNAAVDPQSVADFTARTRLTPEQKQAMITAGARDATTVDQSAMEHNREQALASGMDPLGVAGYTSSADRASRIDEANAAANARVTADQVGAQREQGILGAEQNLQQQRANAAGIDLQTEQAKEANASQRTAGIAANRQSTNQTLATNRQGVNQANQATQYNQGQYVEGQTAGRAAGVADTARTDQQAGRNYLTGQEQTDINAAGQAEKTTAALFGATNTGANAATANQVQAQNKPAWWQSLLSAGAQVGSAAAGRPPS